jgi:hypothetical protein
VPRWSKPTSTSPSPRTVILRDETYGPDHRHLSAYVDELGLHIDGQDLGPATSTVSDDGEYEWFTTYAPADGPRVVALLDGQPGEDILDLLQRDWTQTLRSYELERRLHESGIPFERHGPLSRNRSR